jgi:steroid 5-alpha reductase family enzyme
MPMISSVFTSAALLLLFFMFLLFAIGQAAKDNSIADIAYGPAFLVAGWSGLLLGSSGELHSRSLLLLLLVSLWGMRLAVHLAVRHHGRGEDFRYQNFRRQWGKTVVWRSFLQVYLLQGTIILLISTPILLTAAAPGPPLGLFDFLGLLVFATGLLFEAVSDFQLLIFKKDPGNRGKIIMHGLWRYSRHPNYFGEALLWWGIFLLALPGPHGLYGLVAPLTIAFLLLKVSGIPMLEAKYQDDPLFQAYRQRTNAFFPWLPKDGKTS